MPRDLARAFVAGFLATLLFHQLLLTGFWAAGLVEAVPYNMNPTKPLGVPAVISLAFWGGVWGLPAWLLLRSATGSAYWIRATLFGALGPSAVALAIVFPLKGLGFMAGWNPKLILAALMLNAAWGLGVAIFLKAGGNRSASG